MVLIAVGIAALGSGGDRPAAPAAAPPECEGDAPGDLRRRLGARVLVRMEGEATRVLRDAARAGEIGGVVVFPPPGQDPDGLAREIASLQEAAEAGGSPPLLVAIDQEGGEVKRLPDLPPDIPPPELAGDPTAAREQGVAAGEALAELGINIDLAPVLDVPAVPESFIASRAFGTDATEVAQSGVAFAEGLAAGGIAATAKHFPGLGRAPANTDLAPSEVGADRAQLEADLEPFEAAIAAGVELVMLANATYPAIDRRLAFASAPIVGGLLRAELGFEGVTITDDLGAGAVTAAYEDVGEAAIAAAAAGTDLLLFALTSRPDVLDALVAATERGRLDPGAIAESCARVAGLRRSLAGRAPG